MDSKPNQQPQSAKMDSPESLDRRDLVQKLGKFGAYAAPFTVLAITGSAANGTGSSTKSQSQKATR
jgi:hypothetical protein